jgi:hypothetical protein
MARVSAFLQHDFDDFDRELTEATAGLPSALDRTAQDDSTDEVTGWLELHWRQNYRSAEIHFRTRQLACKKQGLRELGAFAQWCEAKASYLEGCRGDTAAATRALVTLEQAIDRGRSSWFNRLRSSLLRHRQQAIAAPVVNPYEFRVAVIHSFGELLDRQGITPRFQKWRTRLTDGLKSTSHDQYAEALENLGQLLGYNATRPRYGAATDCRWRGVFGNHRETITWEAKIEHESSTAISAHAVGQAHNQRTRAETEMGSQGYIVHGTIVTHLRELDPTSAASIGAIKVIRKDAMAALWTRVNELLGVYASKWSADTPEASLLAADHLAPSLPPTGWLNRALSTPTVFVETSTLLAEWPQ